MRQRANVAVGVLVAAGVVGLFVTWVRFAREAAGRTRCSINLRQIEVAQSNYHDVYGTFTAATARGHESLPPERRLSWLFDLDPFIFARMDPEWKPVRDEPWDGEKNTIAARRDAEFSALQCRHDKPETDELGRLLTHYVAATGVGRDAARLAKEDRRAGLFGYDRRFKADEVTDGLANTIAVIETNADLGPWVAGGWPTARGVDPGGGPPVGDGRAFGGRHRGGANVLLADGSVRWLSDGVSGDVLAALVTVAAGDTAELP